MPRNVEIKAILKNRDAAIAAAARLSGHAPEVLSQQDFFFRTSAARLKLRILTPEQAELILYERADVAAARCSHYLIARTTTPDALLEILRRTLGQIGVVRKTRILYQIGQTRVHIDHVEDLGDFLEFEVVLREEQTEDEGQQIVEALLREFGIDNEQLLREAYIDLLARSSTAGLAGQLE
jgi:predicted adenylyl cyclase CyaB